MTLSEADIRLLNKLRKMSHNTLPGYDRDAHYVPDEGELNDGANISWNVNQHPQAFVTLGGNRTLDNPIDMRAGKIYRLRVIQDSTGGWTLSYGSAYIWSGGIAPTQTTTLGHSDVLTFYCTGDYMLGWSNLSYIVPISPGLTGLEAWWSLDEGGGNALDLHGSNELTDNNTVQVSDGVVEGARLYELANSETHSIVDNASLSIGVGTMWMGGWVKLTDKATFQNIIVKNSGAPNIEYVLSYANGADRFSFTVSSDGTATTLVTANNFGSPTAGVWYFVQVWANGTNIAISVNDGTHDTTAFSSNIFDGSSPFVLGTSLNGELDEVFLFKSKFPTAAERTWMYNGGAGRKYSDL